MTTVVEPRFNDMSYCETLDNSEIENIMNYSSPIWDEYDNGWRDIPTPGAIEDSVESDSTFSESFSGSCKPNFFNLFGEKEENDDSFGNNFKKNSFSNSCNDINTLDTNYFNSDEIEINYNDKNYNENEDFMVNQPIDVHTEILKSADCIIEVLQYMKQSSLPINSQIQSRLETIRELSSSLLSSNSSVIETKPNYQSLEETSLPKNENVIEFDLCHLRKKKRTKISHCYKKPCEKNSYVVNFERKFRVVCLPRTSMMNGHFSKMDISEVSLTIIFSDGTEKLYPVERKSKYSKNRNSMIYFQSQIKVSETSSFRVFLNTPNGRTYESEMFFIHGYCDAQYRKKIREFERNAYVIKCEEEDLL